MMMMMMMSGWRLRDKVEEREREELRTFDSVPASVWSSALLPAPEHPQMARICPAATYPARKSRNVGKRKTASRRGIATLPAEHDMRGIIH
eukprot:3863938-Rhodomonas_salina.1